MNVISHAKQSENILVPFTAAIFQINFVFLLLTIVVVFFLIIENQLSHGLYFKQPQIRAITALCCYCFIWNCCNSQNRIVCRVSTRNELKLIHGNLSITTEITHYFAITVKFAIISEQSNCKVTGNCRVIAILWNRCTGNFSNNFPHAKNAIHISLKCSPPRKQYYWTFLVHTGVMLNCWMNSRCRRPGRL